MATHKHGYITASTCSAIMTGKNDYLLAGGIEFAKKLADERLMMSGLIKEIEPSFDGSDATEWGNAYELDAIARYEEINFVSVQSKQRNVELPNRWLSCTPDGFINGDGLIEVKCPYTVKNHREAMLDPEYIYQEHIDQVQMQLYLTGRKWCDIVSYSPRFIEPYDIVIFRATPDESWRSKFESRVAEVEGVIELVTNKIKNR